MKQHIFTFLFTLLVLGWIGFAMTNITDEDLNAIVDEVNKEIEKEITLVDIDTTKWTTQDDACTISEPCDSEDELWQAITTLHGYEVTKYDTADAFMPTRDIRRDEVLKMYYVFAQETDQLPSKDENRDCTFNDLSNAHSDIVPMISQACHHGLFKWSKGKFMPTDSITNAQAVIVLIRMIDGYKDETNVDHYAQNYMQTAESMNLLTDLNISSKTQRDKPASRATVAKLLYRADTK